MKKNVLILKFPYASNFGGGEKHTIDLFEELEKKGIAFRLLSSCRVLLQAFKQRGWHVRSFFIGPEPVAIWTILLFPLTGLISFFLLAILLFYYKTQKDIDTLYCLSLTEKLLCPPIAKLLGMKVIFIEHVSIERWLTKNPFRFLYIWWSSMVRIVAVSRSIKEELTKMGVSEGQIDVIYNGVNLSHFYIQEDLFDHLKEMESPRPKTFNVGTVGRLHEEKGLSFLIRAGHAALEYIPNIRIIIIGTGPEKEKLQWLTKSLRMEPYVQFVGFREDLVRWLSNMDVFVLASTHRESFGMAAAEAMACAKPVIASNIGGIPELIEHKKTGILVEPKDYRSLATELIHLSQDPEECKRLGYAGRERIEQLFTHDMMVNQYLPLIMQ